LANAGPPPHWFASTVMRSLKSGDTPRLQPRCNLTSHTAGLARPATFLFERRARPAFGSWRTSERSASGLGPHGNERPIADIGEAG
jgi:hypothetical protein